MGAKAPSVDQISVKQSVARSTLYAALRGNRLPTREVLAALVTSWGANEVECMRKRSIVERRLEAARLEERASVQIDALGTGGAASTSESHERFSSTSLDTGQKANQTSTSSRTVEKFAEMLRALRLAAGLPTLREISRTGEQHMRALPTSTLSDMLRGRGKRLPSWDTVEAFVAAVTDDAHRDDEIRRVRQQWGKQIHRMQSE
jgi:hypothetical protein